MSYLRWQFIGEANIGSRIIGWFSAGHLSHVDFMLDDGRLLGARSDWVGERPPGVQIRPPEYLPFKRRIVIQMQCQPEQRNAYIDFLYKQIGKPYDYQAIMAFLFNRDWRQPDSWICSELQSAAAEAAGIVQRLYLAANKITPVSLALALTAAGGSVQRRPKEPS